MHDTRDQYFQAEMTDSPFVCPVCVRHGVEACALHKPRTADELEWHSSGRLVPIRHA